MTRSKMGVDRKSDGFQMHALGVGRFGLIGIIVCLRPWVLISAPLWNSYPLGTDLRLLYSLRANLRGRVLKALSNLVPSSQR